MNSRQPALSKEDQELLNKFNNRIRDSGQVSVPNIPVSRQSNLSAAQEDQLPIFVGTKGSAARNINHLYEEINECIEKLQTNVTDAVQS